MNLLPGCIQLLVWPTSWCERYGSPGVYGKHICTSTFQILPRFVSVNHGCLESEVQACKNVQYTPWFINNDWVSSLKRNICVNLEYLNGIKNIVCFVFSSCMKCEWNSVSYLTMFFVICHGFFSYVQWNCSCLLLFGNNSYLMVNSCMCWCNIMDNVLWASTLRL